MITTYNLPSSRSHGLSSHTLYIMYSNIKYKCKTKNIAICDRWKEDFMNFYEDLIPSFVEGNSLHRIDLKKGFEPSNICWKKRIRKPIKTFKQVKDKLSIVIKVVEKLNDINHLKENKEDISLILEDIIKDLKEQRI